ncbi:MAG TPA: hypothetical protein VJP60_00615 [Rhizomicrobium sp.]|nr:hypothetical protein [Rhizomicrobium sp.]
MLSYASERLNRAPSRGARVQGAMLALLVQAGFVLMILLSPSRLAPPHNPTRETILLLHPQPQPTPRSIDARGAAPRKTAPIQMPVLPDIAPPVLAPPSGIAGFGRTLFGCAPERYADLPPDEKTHCPKPGEGLAVNQPPDLMGGPSHVKDNPRWANAMAHKQTLPMLPGGMLFPLVALGAVLDGSISEPNSAFRDPEQWPNERDPRRFMPHDLHEQERIYDAWRKDHPIPPPQN